MNLEDTEEQKRKMRCIELMHNLPAAQDLYKWVYGRELIWNDIWDEIQSKEKVGWKKSISFWNRNKK